MATMFGKVLAGTIDRFVRVLVVPIADLIPLLVSSGILLVAFGALWLGFGAALVANPDALDETWGAIGQLPLPIQGFAWLLGLPLMLGLWIHGTDWPLLVRLALIAAIAGWNLLVFLPGHHAPEAAVRA